MLKVARLMAVFAIAGPALAQNSPAQNSLAQDSPDSPYLAPLPYNPTPLHDPPPYRSLPTARNPERNPERTPAEPDSSRPDGAARRLSQAELNTLSDACIGMAKTMLQMSPEQTVLWPPVEEAIRNVLELGYRRIASEERRSNPVALMRSRGEALSQQGDRIRKLAEAWQPLYQILTPEQKDRMRLVEQHILCETRGALGCRMGENEEEDDDDEEDEEDRGP